MNVFIENPMNNRTVNINGDLNNSPVVTGDNSKVYINIMSSIWETFEDRNIRATRNSRPFIEGLDLIMRDEVNDVESAFKRGQSALIVGDSGTGKSGLGFLLMDGAEKRKQPRLMLDCRNFYGVSNSVDLQNYLSLGNLSLSRACLEITKEWQEPNMDFLLVFDQVDNIAGSAAGREIIQTALDCHSLGIHVVVISRQKEVREEALLAPLVDSRSFHRVESIQLLDSLPYFKKLKIINSSEEVVELGRNLLNLSLIAAIHQKNPDFDFSNLTNDVMLWKARLDVFQRQHTESGDALMAELSLLAAKTLKSPEGTFRLDDPENKHHNRLISEGFIRRRSQNSRICIFSHENLQNFVYATNALKDGMNESDISSALGIFRAQNVIVWMEKIAKVDELEDPTREARLRRIFDV